MANQNSAKGNPASKRMTNPKNKEKRVKNRVKNENLKAKGQHPKQLRAKAQEERHLENKKILAFYGFKSRKQIHKFRQMEKSS